MSNEQKHNATTASKSGKGLQNAHFDIRLREIHQNILDIETSTQRDR